MEARPLADTIVVNIGDLTQRWTNDRYRSTTHRVLNSAAHARYSMGYFFGPNYDTPIACLPNGQSQLEFIGLHRMVYSSEPEINARQDLCCA